MIILFSLHCNHLSMLAKPVSDSINLLKPSRTLRPMNTASTLKTQHQTANFSQINTERSSMKAHYSEMKYMIMTLTMLILKTTQKAISCLLKMTTLTVMEIVRLM